MKIILDEDYLDFSKGTEVRFEKGLCYGNDKFYGINTMIIEDQDHKVALLDSYFKKRGSLPKLKIVIE